MRLLKSVKRRRNIAGRQYNIIYLYYSNLYFIKNIEFQLNLLKNPFNIFFIGIRESRPINFTLARLIRLAGDGEIFEAAPFLT